MTTELLKRMRAFFDDNPDEELRIEDAKEKFDASHQNLASLLYRRRRIGEFEVVIRRKKEAA